MLGFVIGFGIVVFIVGTIWIVKKALRKRNIHKENENIEEKESKE